MLSMDTAIKTDTYLYFCALNYPYSPGVAWYHRSAALIQAGGVYKTELLLQTPYVDTM